MLAFRVFKLSNESRIVLARRHIYIESEDVKVITVPSYIERNWKKHARMANDRIQKQEMMIKRQGNLKKPIIKCKNSKLNHHYGQTYEAFKPVPLASLGWRKGGKYKGDHFTILKYLENPNIISQDLLEEATFSSLGLSQSLVDVCTQNLSFHNPTLIQLRAIPPLLKGANCLMAAETGSGKTAAFLLPIIQNVVKKKNSFTSYPPNSPIALVITPGRELTKQVWQVAKAIAEPLSLSVGVIVGGNNKRNLLHPHIRPIDLLVASFGSLNKLTAFRQYDLMRTQTVVLDESDTLLDDSFSEKVARFLRRFPFQDDVPESYEQKAGTQLVLVGATLPKAIDSALQDVILPNSLVNISSDRLDSLLPHIKQTFVRISKGDRTNKLMELLQNDLSNKMRVIIFCNSGSCCNWLSLHLASNNIANSRINGDMSYHNRKYEFERFQMKEVDVLVSTDLGSRGLDTANVHHVINFDVPQFMSDYIHRIGRVGRIGGEENVSCTTLVTARKSVPLVQEIELSVRKNIILPNIDANITKLLQEHYRDAEGFNNSVVSYVME